MTDKMYTTPQAAKYLSRSYSGLKVYIRAGNLTGFMPHPNLRMFTEDELDKFAKEFPVAKVPEPGELVKEFSGGTSAKELAEKYSVNINTIYANMKKQDDCELCHKPIHKAGLCRTCWLDMHGR